jgi:protein-S-isoprenylcysteine O-methyltransferase Ste14
MQDRANVAVLPPLIPLAMVGGGLAAHFAFPLALAPAGIAMPLGVVAVLASIVLVAAAARELSKARTAFDVRKSTTALVSSGVFRWSRNPVYFSMVLLCLGIALLMNSLPMVLLSLPAGSLLCLWIIRPEESYLERKFGEAYLTYRATVRRWI